MTDHDEGINKKHNPFLAMDKKKQEEDEKRRQWYLEKQRQRSEGTATSTTNSAPSTPVKSPQQPETPSNPVTPSTSNHNHDSSLQRTPSNDLVPPPQAKSELVQSPSRPAPGPSADTPTKSKNPFLEMDKKKQQEEEEMRRKYLEKYGLRGASTPAASDTSNGRLISSN